MRTLTRISMAIALLAGAFVAFFAAPVAITAQDASPVAEECPVLTPDENVALVIAYIQAYDEAHLELLEEYLHDEYTDTQPDHPAVTPDDTSNADEHQLALLLEATFPGSTYVINEVIAIDDTRVLADTTLQITHVHHQGTMEVVELETPLLVPSIAIVHIECGKIIYGHAVSDTLPLLLAAGFEVSLPDAED